MAHPASNSNTNTYIPETQQKAVRRTACCQYSPTPFPKVSPSLLPSRTLETRWNQKMGGCLASSRSHVKPFPFLRGAVSDDARHPCSKQRQGGQGGIRDRCRGTWTTLSTPQVPRRDKKGSIRIMIKKEVDKSKKGTPATPTPSFPGDRENREKKRRTHGYIYTFSNTN